MKAIRVLFVAAAIAAPALSFADEGAKGSKKGVTFEEGTPAFAVVLEKAKTASKPAFLDFYTDT